jgi:tetratricopeptide (TPR) repeat protein
MSPQACIDQALCVRPYDGNVLFKAGEEAALTGDVATAVAHWKRAFAAGPVVQSQLIDYAAQRGFPLTLFTTQFDLDLHAFRHLHARYRTLAPVNEFDEFLRRFIAALEQFANTNSAPAAADLWLEAHRLAGELSDAQLAGRAARRAIACDPGHFEAHRTLGEHLLAQGDYEEAESQLRWCQMRRPGDSTLTKLVEQATKGRIDSQTRTFSAGAPVPLANDWSHSGDR